jgi:site-specific recombinase XerD
MPDANTAASTTASNVVALDTAKRRSRTTRPRRPAATAPPGLDILDAYDSWLLALNARGRSEGTKDEYLRTLRQFTAWLTSRDFPVTVEATTVEHIRLFLAHERQRTSPGNAHKHFRNLRAFYRWVRKEGHRPDCPVDSDDEPHTPQKEFPPLSDEEIRALLKTCHGNAFNDLRDEAIMRVLLDIGPRVSGLAGLRLTPRDADSNDVQLVLYRIRIRLKGGDIYWAPIGKKTAAAVDRYLRRGRARHPFSGEEWLWLGRFGRLTGSGIKQMLERRGEQAGIAGKVNPHRWRRTSATKARANGMSETDTMLNYGWKTGAMVRRYTQATERERAREAHARFSPGDQF